MESVHTFYFPCGVLAEKQIGENGEVEVRLRDSLGFSFWSPDSAPVFLDRHKAGRRYLWLPPSTKEEEMESNGQLAVVGEVLSPEFNDQTVMPFSEEWNYIDIEYFPEGIEWETVKKGGYICHRLIQDGRFGEWAYMTQPARLNPVESEISFLILPETSCGEAPPRQLFEVLSVQTGVACLGDGELEGFLYLVSEPKNTESLRPAVAELTIKEGKVVNLVLLLGGSSAYSRFPDLGEKIIGVYLWGHLGDADPGWPCTHCVWNPHQGVWEDFTNLDLLRANISEDSCSHERVNHKYIEPLEGWMY